MADTVQRVVYPRQNETEQKRLAMTREREDVVGLDATIIMPPTRPMPVALWMKDVAMVSGQRQIVTKGESGRCAGFCE